MKDVAGENDRTIVSYLKGALMLLGNCGKLLTDSIMGLLKDKCCSTEYKKFTESMTSVYFEHKRTTNVIDYMTYRTLSKGEYRTLYRDQK